MTEISPQVEDQLYEDFRDRLPENDYLMQFFEITLRDAYKDHDFKMYRPGEVVPLNELREIHWTRFFTGIDWRLSFGRSIRLGKISIRRKCLQESVSILDLLGSVTAEKAGSLLQFCTFGSVHPVSPNETSSPGLTSQIHPFLPTAEDCRVYSIDSELQTLVMAAEDYKFYLKQMALCVRKPTKYHVYRSIVRALKWSNDPVGITVPII
jgi:hypothetical protein